MRIEDWFDIKNYSHLRAYDYLMKVGHWPSDFHIPFSLEFDEGWDVRVKHNIVKEYLKIKLEGVNNV